MVTAIIWSFAASTCKRLERGCCLGGDGGGLCLLLLVCDDRDELATSRLDDRLWGGSGLKELWERLERGIRFLEEGLTAVVVVVVVLLLLEVVLIDCCLRTILRTICDAATGTERVCVCVIEFTFEENKQKERARVEGMEIVARKQTGLVWNIETNHKREREGKRIELKWLGETCELSDFGLSGGVHHMGERVRDMIIIVHASIHCGPLHGVTVILGQRQVTVLECLELGEWDGVRQLLEGVNVLNGHEHRPNRIDWGADTRGFGLHFVHGSESSTTTSMIKW